MRKILSLLLICTMVLAAACSGGYKAENKDDVISKNFALTDLKTAGTDSIGEPEFQPGEDKQEQQQPTDPKQKKQPATTTTEPAAKPDWDKKIIKNAVLDAEVKNFNAFTRDLREKVKNLGGYIAGEEQSQTEYKIENVISIKVPVAQFDEAVTKITESTTLLKEKKVTSQDVTSEYFDTRSRMAAKQQVRQRYVDLLKEAKNMEEILNVQTNINSIQEDIESAAGRIQYMGHAAAYSTINLTYYQILNATVSEDGVEKKNFGIKLGAAFKTGGSWIVELFIGLVSIWPLFLVGAIIFLLVKRSRQKREVN